MTTKTWSHLSWWLQRSSLPTRCKNKVLMKEIDYWSLVSLILRCENYTSVCLVQFFTSFVGDAWGLYLENPY